MFVGEGTRHAIVDQEGISIGKMITNEYDISTHKDVVENLSALLVVTNQRWIRVALSSYYYAHYHRNYRSIPIGGKTSFVDKLFGGNKKLKFEWLFAPSEPLDTPVRELTTRNISILPLSEISVVSRAEFTINDQNSTTESQLHLLELFLGDNYYTFLSIKRSLFI